jgi:membrane protein DedA with SNARE-associated domain
MAVIQDIIAALWQHDFAALADPHVVGVVYFVMFATLFLENGLLPASFLPGDSLLLLAGALIGKASWTLRQRWLSSPLPPAWAAG